MNEVFRPGRSVETRPRYTDAPFPPYSYVPGFRPHPVSDPAGHLYGQAYDSPHPLLPERWWESKTYLDAIDLFNHGYYWEAHEAYETLWHAAERQGRTADWLKGLIKLSAAVVKLREGNAVGVRRHAERSSELIRNVCPDGCGYAGIDSTRILDFLDQLSATSSPLVADPNKLAPLVLPTEHVPG